MKHSMKLIYENCGCKHLFNALVPIVGIFKAGTTQWKDRRRCWREANTASTRLTPLVFFGISNNFLHY